MRAGKWLNSLLIGVCVVAGPMSLEAKIVEGRATVLREGRSVEQTQARAVAQALVACVEKVVGVTVQSDFSSELQEVVKGQQSEFNARVRDTVLKSSEGFIKSHEVLEVRPSDSEVFVRVRADVYESKVQAKIRELADLLAAAGNPRVMVVVQEVVVAIDGTTRVAASPQFATRLERALHEKGFELQGKRRAGQIAGQPVGNFEAFFTDLGAAAKLARDQGADVLIAGRVVVQDKGTVENAMFASLNGMRKANIEIALKAVLSSTGQILSPKSVAITEMGSDLERAVYRAYKGRGNNAFQQILDAIVPDIRSALVSIAEKGRRYLVVLQNVKSFRRQGQPFLRLLVEVEGVRSAAQRAFGEGKLEVEVECKCSASELQQRVFKHAEEARAFESLDIVGVESSRLSFSL